MDFLLKYRIKIIFVWILKRRIVCKICKEKMFHWNQNTLKSIIISFFVIHTTWLIVMSSIAVQFYKQPHRFRITLSISDVMRLDRKDVYLQN